ncbi:MAG: glycosyltransferase family 4 protein [Lachnospiraceae bacterium]|nr:glycosyltransferase family 4 protein [Lachnospiraceae bacterium]
MKLTFVSNYINHHQIPLADRLYEELGEDYCFIQTMPMEKERVAMGWGTDIGKIPYAKCFYEEEEECRRLILESDIVIFGGVEDETYIEERLRMGKPVIRYSERIYREGQWKAVSPRGLRKKYHDHIRYRKAPVYLLCAGAYVASDFALIGAYPDKKYCFGYFPAFKEQNIEELMKKKRERREKTGKVRLLFAARLLSLKHPEYPVHLAAALKAEGIAFELFMIGDGEEKRAVLSQIKEKNLEKEVQLLGFLSPQKVREEMEEADIFLFTSDYREGWGAVVNESMNSGCALIAGHGIGAVPYLLKNGENGYVYRTGDEEEFIRMGKKLVLDQEKTEAFGRASYLRIEQEWNEKTAAKRLLELCRGILSGKITPPLSGPCSIAPVISPRKGYLYTKNGNVY